MNAFDVIKEQLSIHDVVAKYTELKEIAPRSYSGLCPLHVEQTPSFRVDDEKGLFYCFGCSKGGSVLDFLHLKENINFGEIPAYVQDHYGIVTAGTTAEDDHEKTLQLRVLKAYCDFFQKEEKGAAEEYLRGRLASFKGKIDYGTFVATEEGTERFIKMISSDRKMLHAAIEVGILQRSKFNSGYYSPFAGRLVFPMMRYGVVLALNGRILDNDAQTNKKYLLSSRAKVWEKKTFVYGLDYARKLSRDLDVSYVYVTEGVMDTIALLESGIPAVCVLGARISLEQFSVITKQFDTMYITFDNDGSGATGVDNSLYSAFNNGIILAGYVVNLPKGTDPADYINKYPNSPKAITSLPTISFEDKIINQHIVLTRKTLANKDDVDFLKRRLLYRICEHLYDYKTNEFSKSLILRLSERMAYNPDFIFSLIDRTIKDAQRKATQVISKVAAEKFSMIVDIADLRLLRLVHTFPGVYKDVQGREWFSRLSVTTRELLDIIVESHDNPQGDVTALISRKVGDDKKKYNEYVKVLTVGVYKHPKGYNWPMELETLDRVYAFKVESDRSRRLLAHVRGTQKRMARQPYAKGRNIIEKAKAKEEENTVI